LHYGLYLVVYYSNGCSGYITIYTTTGEKLWIYRD
jgi:hypothetical protein